ncbi:MAG TPA: type II secretion system protein GspL [Sedimentisphaerales bacterium]|nr:type II secretion system protein GspL [Sedimentisphaerales bacterium]
MEGQNYLGIHISDSSATVVCTDSQSRGKNVVGCFSVSVEGRQEQSDNAVMSELARLIAEGCAQRKFGFSEVAVALDCTMFMQHTVHSEFKEPRQIAQTVRFDTEEALSTDVADVAIAFRIASIDETGSKLRVFTARREKLSNILLSLQSHNFDPMTVEPDVDCLSRFVSRNVSLPEDSSSLFGMLSRRTGYLVGFRNPQETPVVRTFLVGKVQNRADLLARQIPVTAAMLGGDGRASCLKVFDSTGSVNHQQLSEKLGAAVAGLDLTESVVTDSDALVDCADTVDFAIACGAALAHTEKIQGANFRDDFMPYQGKKMRLQKTVKFLSVSLSILIIALGIYVTSQLLQKNQYLNRLRAKFQPDYSAVMSGQKLRGSMKEAVRKLESVSRRIKSEKEGLISEEDLSARLRLVLEAFNKCAEQTRLNIDSISITSKTVRISGDTSSRRNTLTLRRALAETKLGSLHENFERTKGGREGFKITIELGK